MKIAAQFWINEVSFIIMATVPLNQDLTYMKVGFLGVFIRILVI